VFLVLVAKLRANVVELASSHGRLQDCCHGPGMPGGLVLAYALFLRQPVVELVDPEGASVPGALHVGGYLRRELGGQVGWLVARQPLPQLVALKRVAKGPNLKRDLEDRVILIRVTSKALWRRKPQRPTRAPPRSSARLTEQG
jgi:hypothetical protein